MAVSVPLRRGTRLLRMHAGRRHPESTAPGLRLLWRALLAWCLVLLAAFATGILRDLLLAPLLGATFAQVLAIAVLFAAPFLGAVWLVHTTRPRRPLMQWLLAGLLWAALTLSFGLLFFHYVVGMPWPAVLAALDPRGGGPFGMVVVATLLAPPVAAAKRRR